MRPRGNLTHDAAVCSAWHIALIVALGLSLWGCCGTGVDGLASEDLHKTVERPAAAKLGACWDEMVDTVGALPEAERQDAWCDVMDTLECALVGFLARPPSIIGDSSDESGSWTPYVALLYACHHGELWRILSESGHRAEQPKQLRMLVRHVIDSYPVGSPASRSERLRFTLFLGRAFAADADIVTALAHDRIARDDLTALAQLPLRITLAAADEDEEAWLSEHPSPELHMMRRLFSSGSLFVEDGGGRGQHQ